jgi:hypothetical protein
MTARDRRISVRLTTDELARLDVLADGRSRGAALRELLRADAPRRCEAPTAMEALELLAASARDGSVGAQVALAKLLFDQQEATRTPTQARRDELARRRKAKRGEFA